MSAHAVSRQSTVGLEPARLGVWLLIVAVAMFFAGLIAAYVVLREGSSAFGGPEGQLSPRLMGVATALLVISSLCLSRATVAQKNGRGARIVASWARRAIVFGVLFLCFQAIEWRDCLRGGASANTNLYWSSFYVLTGAHALHVVGGVAWLAWAWNSVRAGGRGLRLELAEIYWHFVGLVWIGLFALLYGV